MSSRRYPKMHKMITLSPSTYDVIRFYSKDKIINPIIAKNNKFDKRIAHE